MRVALRHAALSAGGSADPVFEAAGVRVDLANRQVFTDGEEVHLTPLEFKLLQTMVRHAGKVLTHRHLLKEVWGINAINQNHYLRVYITQLRHKLEQDPAQPRLLQTETGVGYRLRSES
jgi:two-component system KDP operon response regulator KdpE